MDEPITSCIKVIGKNALFEILQTFHHGLRNFFSFFGTHLFTQSEKNIIPNSQVGKKSNFS